MTDQINAIQLTQQVLAAFYDQFSNPIYGLALRVVQHNLLDEEPATHSPAPTTDPLAVGET